MNTKKSRKITPICAIYFHYHQLFCLLASFTTAFSAAAAAAVNTTIADDIGVKLT
jgi:uncharacterized membrane protein (DUF485 family)